MPHLLPYGPTRSPTGLTTRVARTIQVPFPDARLAQAALRALSVDEELSPLVQRSFELPSRTGKDQHLAGEEQTILLTHYSATTNRMLRVALNGFFESLGVVLSTMRELDEDVVGNEWFGDGLDELPEDGRGDGGVGKIEEETEKQIELKELRRVQGIMEMGQL